MDSVFVNDVDKNSAILQQFLIKHLVLLPDLQEVNSIAEYIILLITNGSSKDQIIEELASLGINDKSIASDLLDRVFYAIQQLKNGVSGEELMKNIPNAQQQQQQQQQPETPTQQQPQQTILSQQPTIAPQQQPQATVAPALNPPAAANFQFSFGNAAKATSEEVSQNGSLNTEEFFTPKSLINKRQAQNKLRNALPARSIGNGRNNNSQRGGKFAAGSRYHESNQRNYNHVNAAPQSRTPMNRAPKLGRCPEFPNCPLSAQNCPHAHPNVICRAYPDCPNVNGTCSYLHPDEDEQLIELVKQNKVKMLEKREELKRISLETQKQKISGITLCKFGSVCSNPKCPFGHPTPVNEDQKVSDYSWCNENLSCVNSACIKAHSSASKIKPVDAPVVRPLVTRAPKEQQLSPEDRGLSLEQCKYNEKCTNKRCKFRHAKSATLCREGTNCTRYDCIFSHPIQENCRWDTECTNPRCLFQHPNGKNNSSEVFNPQKDYTIEDSSMTNDQPQQEVQNQFMNEAPNNFAHREHVQQQNQFQFGQPEQNMQYDLSQQQQQPPQFNFNQPQQ